MVNKNTKTTLGQESIINCQETKIMIKDKETFKKKEATHVNLGVVYLKIK